MPDAHRNFSISAVAVAPTPPTSGNSLTVTTGEGARFPAAPFNAVVCPAATDADPSNAEVIRVTNVSINTFTIQRAQETSTARAIIVGDRIYAAVTAKSFTDVETDAIAALARANHTGTQTASTISNFDTQVRTSRLDQMAAPTASVSAGNQKITSLGTPTADTDAATKAYADSISAGLDPHASVKAATTANITISTALNSGDVIDGVTLANGDRVLVKNQTAQAENGIYVTAASPARSTDADTGAELSSGAFVFVEQGTTQAGQGWITTQTGTPTLGTDPIIFSQYSGTTNADASTTTKGLTKLSVAPASASNPIAVGANDPHLGTIFERSLAVAPSVGASTITVDVAPAFAANLGFIVIDPYTSQCELRRVSGVSGNVLTLSGGNLVYSHAIGDSVLFVEAGSDQPLEWWGLTSGADISPTLQTAVDAVRPSGVARSISIPMGQYRADSTVYVPSDSWIKGVIGYSGTTISINGDFVLFDVRGGSPPHTSGSSKTHTRAIFHGFNFIRQTNTTSSAYVIDISGDSSMCEVGWCVFGDNNNGCLNGVRGDGSATWIHHCRFLRINDATVAGITDPKGATYPASAGDGAAIKMADATGTTTSMVIESCQFERQSKIQLLNVRGFHIHDCHFESSQVQFQNSCDNVFRDNYLITSHVLVDNMSNDNTFADITGRGNRLVNHGSNTFSRCDFKGIARNVQGFGPFHASTSPITPDRVGTVYSSNPQVAYGTPGDVLLFAVKLMAPKNATSNASTVIFKNTNGGGTLHTSPSITLTTRAAAGAIAQDTDTFIESYTYWHLETVPAGGKIYIETTHRHSVWASKTINSHPILASPASTLDWGGSATSGYFTNQTNATATHTGGVYRVNFTANTAWSIRQLFPWPTPVPKLVMFVLRGRWATTQGMQVSETTDASDGSDIARARTGYKSGDETYNLQTSDKMLFLVADLWNTPSSGAFGFAFGGYSTDFPANTEIEIDWAAVVPLSETTTSAASGSVATDTIWDAKGDLAAGTGADAAAKVTAGANDTVLIADSAQSTGLKYAQVANAQVSSSAAIAYGKLALTNAIVNGDVSSSAAIAYSKLNLATSIVNGDIASGAAIALSKLAITGTPTGTKFLRDDGSWQAPTGSGAVATDTIWDTKGDLAVATGADAASKLAVGANLTHQLVADSATSTGLKWVPHVVRKTADETVSANTTLQNDDHLLWAVAANEVWFVQAWLLVSAANATMDFKAAWSLPAGATLLHGALGGPSNNYSSWGPATTGGGSTLLAATTPTAYGTAAGTTGINMAGLCVVSSTAGNVNLQWAQNVSDAGNLSVLTNSFLLLWRLA